MPDIPEEVLAALAPGDECPHTDCSGHMDTASPIGCSCHLSAPCYDCMNAGLECTECDLATVDQYARRAESEREYEKELAAERLLRPARNSRRDSTTTTHTANPYNSTPFTRCCGVASFGARCENCGATITYHDDGLTARRRQVGPGNCLMCGQPRGDIAIRGNCCC